MILKRSFKITFEGLFYLNDHNQTKTSKQLLITQNLEQTQLRLMEHTNDSLVIKGLEFNHHEWIKKKKI